VSTANRRSGPLAAVVPVNLAVILSGRVSIAEIAYLAPSLGRDPPGLLAYARSSIFAILQKLSLRSLAMTGYAPSNLLT